MTRYKWLVFSTCFFMVTAQIFWQAVHGDGAVYAWLIQEFLKGDLWMSTPPTWRDGHQFGEHPYLFFIIGAVFSKVLGTADWAIKIPNYVIAGLSIALVYFLSLRRNQLKIESEKVGLLAAYALVLNSNFIMQVSQPSLDPLLHLLALGAVSVLIYGEKKFLAGLLLGFGFLAKGLEVLPHLGAILLLISLWPEANVQLTFKESLRLKSAHLGILIIGFAIPALCWLSYDQLMWKGNWRVLYWHRQFTSRFFNPENMHSFGNLKYLKTLLNSYFIELSVLACGFFYSQKWRQKFDPLYFYLLAYLALNILAFTIIKKESSQHLFGVILIGSLFVAETLVRFFQTAKTKIFMVLPYLLFAASFAYWIRFTAFDQNDDLWNSVKNEASKPENLAEDIYIVVNNSDENEGYGIFSTAQWYFKTKKIYTLKIAKKELIGQEVLELKLSDKSKLEKNKILISPN